ncbi:hypothetical protein BVX98_05200 [bacterium F11]|nr:hypothetical protein BVX98_05200 [bacterium F11]
MKFCTVINCMDGRVQLPVIRYLQKRFQVDYVDSVTEPGPNLIVSEQKPEGSLRSIENRLKISLENHHSLGVAIAGHDGCAGNPASEDQQKDQIKKAIRVLQKKVGKVDVIGLWIDNNFNVQEVNP